MSYCLYDINLYIILLLCFFLKLSWTTFVIVERRSAVILEPPSVGLDVACLVPCSGITAFGAIANAMPVIEKTFQHKGTNEKY